MAETLAHGYSSESTRRGLSKNTKMTGLFSKIFASLCFWAKVASALEGLRESLVGFKMTSSFKHLSKCRYVGKITLEKTGLIVMPHGWHEWGDAEFKSFDLLHHMFGKNSLKRQAFLWCHMYDITRMMQNLNLLIFYTICLVKIP